MTEVIRYLRNFSRPCTRLRSGGGVVVHLRIAQTSKAKICHLLNKIGGFCLVVLQTAGWMYEFCQLVQFRFATGSECRAQVLFLVNRRYIWKILLPCKEPEWKLQSQSGNGPYLHTCHDCWICELDLGMVLPRLVGLFFFFSRARYLDDDRPRFSNQDPNSDGK